MRAARLRLSDRLGRPVAAGVAALLLLLAPMALAADTGPRRVVSMNVCADQLVLLLADPDRIAGISQLGRDPGLSYMAAAASRVAEVSARAEAVLALKPDLVIAGRFGAQATVALLRRLGVPLLELAPLVTLDDAFGQIHDVAAALGEVERGERLLRDIQTRLERVAARAPARPAEAAIYQANGILLGRGTVADALLSLAGLDNLAERLGQGQGGYVSMEALLLAAPDLVVIDSYRPELASLAEQGLRHPALRAVRRMRPFVSLPMRLWICPTPGLAEAAELLADAAGRLAP